jgi:CheY-like chemotaxis protein
MTPEQVDRLFQAFTQGDASTVRQFGGTGLGLVISKRLAEMLGGTVRVVETQLGVGTCMRASVQTGCVDGVHMLDRPLSATTLGEAPRPRVDASPRLACTILLAEDGLDNRRLISHVLEKAGAELATAENGEEAVAMVVSAASSGRPYDIVLMDMQMPVMDGYEATAVLRGKGYGGTIIALTAHAMASDREKCLRAGCDDYATKPIDRKSLIETIRLHVRRSEAKRAIAGSPDPEDSARADRFIRLLPQRMAAIQQAMGKSDLDVVALLAHQLAAAPGGADHQAVAFAAANLERLAAAKQDLDGMHKEILHLIELCRVTAPSLSEPPLSSHAVDGGGAGT